MAQERGTGGGFLSEEDRKNYLSGGKTQYQQRSPVLGTIPGQRTSLNSALLGSEIGGLGNNVSTPTPGTGVKGLTAQYLHDQALTQAERTAAAQRQIAQQTLSDKQKSLEKQLEEQRRNYMLQLQSLNEQSYGRGNDLLQGLANRGLATSGLLQLGDTQTQMAKGQGMSNIAYENRVGQENISGEGLGALSSYQRSLTEANLGEQAGRLYADENLFNREDTEKQRQQELLLSIMEAAGSENFNPANLDIIRSIFPGLGENESGSSILDEIKASVDINAEDALLGGSGFNEIGLTGVTNKTVNIGGKEFQFSAKNPEAFNTAVQSHYDNSSLRYAGEGLIKIDAGRSGLGRELRGNLDVVRDKPFVVGTKRFPTWNAAADYIDEQKANK